MLYISSVTKLEIRFGIELVAEPVRRAELDNWLTHRVRPMFGGRVLPVTEDVMLKWRLLVEEGRKTGHDFSQPDRMIGGSAPEFGPAVVSSVTSDYEKVRLPAATAWPAAAWL